MINRGNYISKLIDKPDPILRLYGMRFNELKKDFEFYESISETFGFASLKLNVAVRDLKRAILKDLKEMTLLGWINYFVQFLFIRIYASYNADGSNNRKHWKIEGYGILYFVLPLTGWFNNYAVLTKKLKYTKLLYKCK